jgi:Uma2 family endonuclease
MAEAGILDEDGASADRGEIVEMTPIGPPHASVVAASTRCSRPGWEPEVSGPRIFVFAGGPRSSSPIYLVPADFYASRHPEPTDASLVIEVMDSSVARDRRVKLPIYARARVEEVWLVHAVASTVEVCRDPRGSDYRDRRVLERSATLAPLAFPDLVLTVADIVG